MLCLTYLTLTLLSADGGVPDSGTTDLKLKVGQTRKVPVGGLQGLLCDDTTVMTPSLEGGSQDNLFVATGVKPGSTLCRVGTGNTGHYRLIQITVTAKDAP